MRKMCLAAMLVVLAPAAAFAGGMGDPSTVLRQNNAICEMQKRGEGPLQPNLCLPEYPPYPVAEQESRHRK